jgi:hypothetical protein
MRPGMAVAPSASITTSQFLRSVGHGPTETIFPSAMMIESPFA